MATLNWLLGREGLAPLKVESAGSLVGAGARALIERGFAASGKTLDPQAIEALFADYLAYYNAHIADRTRLYPGVDKALAALRARWLAAGGLHQQDRRLGQAPDRQSSASPSVSPSSAARTRSGLASRTPKPLLKTIAASGGASERAIMVGDSGTDIKTARAAGVPVIAVDFGYADVPVEELGPDRVISHFDELMAACEALLRSPAS